MSPGDLESMRTEGEQHGLSRCETLTLLEHLDAIADQRNVAMSRLFDSEKARNEITADRDEARAEVAALRAQRDEIREVHRVELAALTAKLDERDGDMHARIRAGYDATVADCWRAKVAEVTARLEAAERERETNAERCLEALDDIAKLLVERNAAQARADAAEAKLAALVEAHDAWKRYGNPTSPVDLDEAIRAARGPA